MGTYEKIAPETKLEATLDTLGDFDYEKIEKVISKIKAISAGFISSRILRSLENFFSSWINGKVVIH